jgi:hypothetical protein
MKSANIFTLHDKSEKVGKPNYDDFDDSNSNSQKSIETVEDILYSEPNATDDLFEIMKKIYHNNDLNVLLKAIHSFTDQKGKQPFNRSDMSVHYNGTELDKFNKTKGAENFSIKIQYSLND